VEEAALEAGPYLRYRQILRSILERLGSRFCFRPSASELDRFGGSVVDWPPFADSADALAALKRTFKLAFITNCDDDLIAGTIAKLGVTPDWIVTAQQVGSYKPSPRNFLAAFERTGLPRERILHVAQSLYHDHTPAKELGLRTVWVNRRGESPVGAKPDLEVPDLATLARMFA
jgi:2-haloacid dehalogenase